MVGTVTSLPRVLFCTRHRLIPFTEGMLNKGPPLCVAPCTGPVYVWPTSNHLQHTHSCLSGECIVCVWDLPPSGKYAILSLKADFCCWTGPADSHVQKAKSKWAASIHANHAKSLAWCLCHFYVLYCPRTTLISPECLVSPAGYPYLTTM